MNFRRVAIYVSNNAAMPFPQLYTASIADLYSYYLKGKAFGDCHSINIYLTTLAAEDGVLYQFGGFINFYFLFDFNAYYSIETPYERKVCLIDTIQNSVLSLAKQKDWETTRFDKAYEDCFAAGLKLEWNFREKLFLSPNREYYFSLFCTVDFNSFVIYEVLYDKKKEEIFRRQCFVDILPTFTVEWAKWKANSKEFSYKLSSHEKVFTAKLTDLINKREYSMSRHEQDIF